VCHKVHDDNCARHLAKQGDPCRHAVQLYPEEPVLPVDAENKEEDESRQHEGENKADEEEDFGGFLDIFYIHPGHPGGEKSAARNYCSTDVTWSEYLTRLNLIPQTKTKIGRPG
jgi:hypothetical protein